MITLKTLKDATAQEVFDQVAEHLLTQNKRSSDPDKSSNMCLYRSPEGLKCAIGCLIADDEYLAEWEGKDWLTTSPYIARDLGIVYKREHAELLTILQHVHDYFEVDLWLDQLKDVAQQQKLNSRILKKYEN